MKFNYPKKDFLSYFESKEMFESGPGAPFAPFSCVKSKNYNEKPKLLIGYTKCGKGIFITDSKISLAKGIDMVQAYWIKGDGVKEYYENIERPSSPNSIFKKPEVGDTVLCVAKDRYVCCEFGETYEVLGVTGDGRINVSMHNNYTYEDVFFVVVDSKRIKAEVQDTVFIEYNRAISGDNIIIGNSYYRDQIIYGNSSANIGYPAVGSFALVPSGNGVSVKNPCGEVILGDKPIQRKTLIDEDIKVRRVLENKKILTRREVKDSDIKIRRLQSVNIVKRKINK